MSGIETAIGWALLQFVWQGAVIGAATALALALLRRSAADVRYLVASIGLLVMLTLPIVTAAQRWTNERAAALPVSDLSALTAAPAAIAHADMRTAGAALGGATAAAPAISESAWRAAAAAWAPMLLVVWLAGVAFLSLRLLAGWLRVQSLRRRGVKEVDATWTHMADRLARQLRVRRAVRLLESRRIDVPTVVGWLSPVVLLPASALAGLAPEQLEAILAHEFAHIRRHDYCVNLLQTLVETLLFYHPAVWWVSRRIRIEREHCCDDLAVSLCGDPITYAAALADLEALRAPERHGRHQIAMAATGGSLLHRVRRLLAGPASQTGSGPTWIAAALSMLFAAGVALGAENARYQRPILAAGPAAPAAPAALAAVPPAAPAPAAARAVEAATPVSPAVLVGPRAPVAPALAEPSLTPPAHADDAVGAPALAPAPQASVSIHQDNSTGSFSWSHDGSKLEATYSGTFDFSDDDADVRSVSTGGWLKISDGAWLGRHSVEIANRDGSIERRYFVNGAERPFDPEGREWLHDHLPALVRNTGIAAPQRIARILKQGGVPAVLADISRADSAYVKSLYYRELIKQASLTGDQYRQVVVQAGREMKGSDYALATLLIALADKVPNDDASRGAYFDAASGISSDYDMRRVYTAMLTRGPASPRVLSAILSRVGGMHSDYDKSELLRQILDQPGIDESVRQEAVKAAGSLTGDYERHRVLTAAIGSEPSAATIELALTQAASIHGDYDAATFLTEVLDRGSIEGRARAPFFAAVGGIKSDTYRGRVLLAVLRRDDVSHETLKAVLQSAQQLTGYSLSQVLTTAAGHFSVTGDLRDAYLAAADHLNGFQQDQAMSALVRSERRKS